MLLVGDRPSRLDDLLNACQQALELAVGVQRADFIQ